MAKRRCFSIDVFESYEYLTLSDKAKTLYTGLMLRSDDEGVVINPYAPLRLLGFGEEVFTELVEKGFVFLIDDVYIITHWHVHNQIPPSKKNPSLFKSQLEKLSLNEQKLYVKEKNAEKFCTSK